MQDRPDDPPPERGQALDIVQRDVALDGIYGHRPIKGAAVQEMPAHGPGHPLVGLRLQILERQILELPLHAADAETSPLSSPEAFQYDINVGEVAELWRRGEYIPMSLDIDLARGGAVGTTQLLPAQ